VIADLNEEEALTLTSATSIYKSINKLEKKYIKLPVVKPPFNFLYLTGWGV